MAGPQVLGEVDLDDKSTTSPSGPQILGEVDLPATPSSQVQSAVDAAVRSVPRPASPVPNPTPSITDAIGAGFGNEAESKKKFDTAPFVDAYKAGPGEAVQGAKDIVTSGAVPALASRGAIPNSTTDEQRRKAMKGISELVSGAGTTAAPFVLPEAVAAAPVATAADLAVGAAASKGAGYLAKKLGASPEAQEMWETLGFWAPASRGIIAEHLGLSGAKAGISSTPEGTTAGVAGQGGTGAGVAVTPDEIRLSGQFRGGPMRSVSIGRRGAPAGPGLEPPTIDAIPQDPAVQSIVKSKQMDIAATRVNQGMPAVPPPPPAPRISDSPNAPASVKAGQISPADVDKFATAVSALPEQLRGQAIQEAHGTLSKVLLEQGQKGPVVLPDGKLALIKDPADAEKAALELINTAVEDHDQKMADAAKAAKTAGPEKPSEVSQSIVAARAGVQASKRSAPVVPTAPSAPPQVLGEVDLEQPTQSTAQATPPRTATPEETPAPSSGPIALGEENLIKKGDRVTLPGGEVGTVHYISETNDSVARVEVPVGDGKTKRVNVQPSKLKLASEAPERRKDTASRSRVEDMTHEEMKKELLTSHVVDLPNRRAFDDAPKSSAVAMSDADGLKALNDKFGYEAGNELLKAKAEALKESGLDAYHEKGDEFIYRGASPEELSSKLDKAREILRNRTIEVQMADGSVKRFKGADFSHGAGTDLKAAEAGLKTHKSEREARGERARGELRGIVETGSKASEVDKSSEVEEPKFKFRSTQHNISEKSEAHAALESARSRIADSDLAGHGKDVGGNHVTVRYGLESDDVAGVRKYLSGLKPFDAELGPTEKFPPSTYSDGAAIIQAPVNSPELHEINAELEKHGEFSKPSFSSYKPHATVAYVKPEKADRYVGMNVTKGKKFKVKSIDITDRNGGSETVPLKGEEPASTEKVDNEGTINPDADRSGHPDQRNADVPSVQGTGGSELAGVQPADGEGTGTKEPAAVGTRLSSRASSAGDEGQPEGRATEEPGTGTGERNPVQSEREVELKSSPKTTPKNQNWFAHPKDFSVDATESKRLEWNLSALRVLKKVEDGGKLTDDDRDALAHYVGWGSLQYPFAPHLAPWDQQKKWGEASKALRELMTPDEFAAASRSTQNAHYTSPEMVRAVWEMMTRMGFKGGNILEPSMGTGNFFGLMPKATRLASHAIGNELDPTTYKIAELLYPGATMFNKDFVDLMMPNDSIDLAISNVPFGVKVYDKNYPKLKASIHDYFFVKALDKVRPGGLLSFITSTYTMDKQRSDIRELLADKGDLMYALRFPQETFGKSAGTAVATDLMVIRKRIPGEEPKGEKFVALRDVQAPYASYHERAGQKATKQINEYFAENPQNVLGDLEIGRGRTSQDAEALVVIKPHDFPELLEKAIKSAPRNAYLSKRSAAPFMAADSEAAFAPDTVKENGYTIDAEGEVKQRINGKLKSTEVILDKDGKPSAILRDRMKRLIRLRDGVRELIRTMNVVPDDATGNAAIEKQQMALRVKAKEYHQRHGYFAQQKTKSVFEDDPDYPLILALEDFDDRSKVGEAAAILTKRTILPPKRLAVLSSDPKEALSQVLGERGFPDVDFMSGISGKTVADVAKPLVEAGLIYRNPSSGIYETKDKYLSGYVRDKLADAKAAVAQGHEEYAPNVKALEAVQPKDIPINSGKPEDDIKVKLGATYLSPEVISHYAREILKAAGNAAVTFADGAWRVAGLGYSAENTSEFAGGSMNAADLLELALNQKQPLVKDTYRDDSGEHTVVNQEKTIAARRAQDKIKASFADWLKNHATLGPQIEKIYNQQFNSLVTPKADGSHLTFPGMNKTDLRDGKLMPHQVDAIWRIVQDGRALLAHVVGAGKTYEMIASAMELKRLGMIRKPMFAVPNHLVGQWSKEFLGLYPGARLLVPSKADFEATRRNKIMSRIATGDWDAVILPHSQFDLMDISPERQRITLNKELDELNEAYMNAKAEEGGKGFTVKRLEKARDRLRAKIAELTNLKADKTMLFDDLGVDHLVVDEAHAYKNLAFYTKMERVGGLAQGNSKRSTRLKMKTDYLLEKHGNRGVVFATGTPIQNTMAEIYNMTKYVAPDVMEKAGIRYFDDWAANFGEVVTKMELSVDGQTYKPRAKFSEFTNVPELQMMFRSFADVKNAEDLNLPVPEVEGGKPIPLVAEQTPETQAYVKELIERALAVRGEGGRKRPDPKDDNMLKITGDGRKAATDMRLIDPSLPDDPASKINRVVDKAYEEWKAGTHNREELLLNGEPAKNLTGLVFLDNYQYLENQLSGDPDVVSRAKLDLIAGNKDTVKEQIKKGQLKVKSVAKLNLYHDMVQKLVARGVPRDQMAIIHDYPKDAQKTQLFADMNAGKVRILFGSTQKMGAGMNAQRRLKWMIDVDSPWRPGDLEQRRGRAIRQGNLNKTIRIYHGSTKGSFDTYMMQTLATKANFIHEVMSGKFKGRTMIDAASEMVLSLEEMMAVSSGNPDVKRKMELEAEVNTLQVLAREFDATKYRRQRDAQTIADTARRYAMLRDQAKEVQAKLNTATEGDKFAFSILGKKFEKYGDAAEWLKDQPRPATNFHVEYNSIPARVQQTSENTLEGTKMAMSYTVEPWDARSVDGMESLLPSLHAFLNPKHLTARIVDWTEETERLETKAARLGELAKNDKFEDADKLTQKQAELEKVKNRLGLGDRTLANADSVAAAVDNSDEPDGDEDNDEAGGTLSNLIQGEEGSFTPGALTDAAAQFFAQDVAPALKTSGVGLKQTAALFVKTFYPRIEETSLVGRRLGIAAPTEAVDALMRLKGQRAKALANFDGILDGMEKMFDRLHEHDRINFIDHMQNGVREKDPLLRDVADALKAIQDEQRTMENEAANLGRARSKAPIELARKENYFPNKWKVRPGTDKEEKAEKEDERMTRLFTPRRPLEGSKGYNKRQSYTLKSGIAAGGEPVTTNPIRLMRNRIEDGMKFVSARRAWQVTHELGLRKYVKRGERPPEGFDKIDDRIAKVYFPAQLEFPGSKEPMSVPHELGEWYVEANTARLINNMLSRDLIRENAAGRGLMWIKNAATAVELGISPFHAVFVSIDAASSQLALGMLRAYNLGIRQADGGQLLSGLRQMLEAPIAPITMAREGAALPAYIEARARLEKIGVTEFGHKQIEGDQPHGILESIQHFRQVREDKNVQRLAKRFPDLDQLVDDMFTGGLVIGQHSDYKVQMLGKTAMEAWTSGNPLGAIIRAVPTIMQGMMYPLFNVYIPNLKYSLFLRQMSEQAAENADVLESGKLTRAQLARRVADSVENRFGEMNFDNLFWNRTFKTALQFAFRSITWKLGTTKEIGGAAIGQAKSFGEWAWQTHQMLGEGEAPKGGYEKLPRLDMKFSWVMSMILATAGIGIVAAKLLSGKYPWEWAEQDKHEPGSAAAAHALYLETVHPRTGELDSRGKPVRISQPTYWKDVEHATSDPGQYVMGSLSEVLGKGIDVAHNEDYFGNYVYNPNADALTKAEQIGKYVAPVPFSISNFRRGSQQGQEKSAWLSAFGFPKAPSDLDFTPAEKFAQKIIKTSEERATPEEMEAWREKREAFNEGKLSHREAEKFIKRARETMLQRQMKNSHITYADAVRVFQRASPEERHSLTAIMREKRTRLESEGRRGEVKAAESAAK